MSDGDSPKNPPSARKRPPGAQAGPQPKNQVGRPVTAKPQSGPTQKTYATARTAKPLTEQQRREHRERELARKKREQRRAKKPIGLVDPSRRLKVMSVSALVLFGLFGARLTQIQLVQGDELAAQALAMRTTETTLVAERGEIVDRNGNLVAKSTTRYNIFADQKLIETWKTKDEFDEVKGGPRYAASLLAPILGIPEAELAMALTKDPAKEKYDQYVVLVKDVAPEMWTAVKDLKIVGMFPETFDKRIYPQGATGSNIIGVAGKDGGLSGLEYSQDELMQGIDGTIKFERGGKGQVIPAGAISQTPAVAGDTINITLDMDIQWHIEDALRTQLKKMGATSGYVVVQDVKTCQVLGLASESLSAGDANTQYAGRVGAVQDIFEPGSTAKIVTMAAALETTDLSPTSEFRVKDRYTTSNGEIFRDSHDHPEQQLTLAGILSESSNTGTVQVAEKIPKQVRHDYLEKFGFGTKTGIELGGESRGILADAADWDGRTQYAVTFGQALAGNAMQTTNVFATVANGGKQCLPHLVAGTTSADGTFTPSSQSETTQVIKEETANDIMKMMTSVVTEGSGKEGAIEGYHVAGKTGTAQAADASGQMNSIVSSFIGVAPVEDPQIVVSVIIRDPKANIYGGVVAAPVFADVMAYSLQRLGIEPNDSTLTLFPTRWGEDAKKDKK